MTNAYTCTTQLDLIPHHQGSRCTSVDIYRLKKLCVLWKCGDDLNPWNTRNTPHTANSR